MDEKASHAQNVAGALYDALSGYDPEVFPLNDLNEDGGSKSRTAWVDSLKSDYATTKQK